ncbi:MAG: RIP metalloprotease RseP [Gammaproteobacteria bacterium]|nr:RIP metalloprotease RseP [Gammaproteobacteria bacterium]
MLNDLIFNVLAFLVALGALITIHEYGHFWVARKVGIKVLRFSIGFGKPLFSRTGRQDGTEFAVAAIPLGGYVKMLDEREGPVAAAEKHRAFNNQSVWARIAVVVAGPLANFLLAILAYWAMFMIGISGLVPLVGGVEENSTAAKAGFAYEDQIIAVGDTETRTWNDVRMALLDKSLVSDESITVTVRDKEGYQVERHILIDSAKLLNGKGDVIGDMGLEHWWPDVEPVIGGVSPGGAAETAGLLPDDLILQANGEPVSSWRQWVTFIRANPDTDIALLIERNGMQQDLLIRPQARQEGAESIGFIGAWETRSQAMLERVRTTVQYGPLDSLQNAVARTWNMTVLTVQMLGKLIVGEASVENISGPITIAQFAGQSASIGLDHYLGFLALISISLGVLNLLPVPMLDGGHLLYFFIEILKGKPLSEKTQLYGQQIGMVLLAGLMSIAFYNDILRLVG